MSYMHAQPTNNPFLSENGGTYDAAASASSRFPDINSVGGGGLSQQQPQQPQYARPNQGYGQSGFTQPQQPQQTGYMQPQLQKNMSFGMGQEVPQQTPSHFGYSSPVQQYPSQQSQLITGQYQPQMGMLPTGSAPTGYPYQPQQLNNYGAIADLDPYSNLSNSSSSNPQPQSYQPQSQYPSSQPQQQQQHSTQYGDHPRAFVQKFKTELEQWDTVAWKQVMLRIADLRSAWEVRKRDLNGALEGARYNGWTPNEITQCEAMIKESNDHVDMCHASEFQLREVQSGYRHSTDPASKRRVREALNAGFKTLPEFPSPL